MRETNGSFVESHVRGLLHKASEGFASVLADFEIGDPKMPLYSNRTGLPYESGTIREGLAAQISSPVRWEDTVRRMIGEGVGTFIEIGPGSTLSGLISKTDAGVKTYQAGDADSLAKVIAEKER